MNTNEQLIGRLRHRITHERETGGYPRLPSLEKDLTDAIAALSQPPPAATREGGHAGVRDELQRILSEFYEDDACTSSVTIDRILALLPPTDAAGDAALLDWLLARHCSAQVTWAYKDAGGITVEYFADRQAIRAPDRPPPDGADADTRRLYDELIYAVGTKWAGETRHQTALRYINQAEERNIGGQDAAMRPDARSLSSGCGQQ